eukprot:TRINITY_DN3006_c0_g1_i1.p1 TRINITY_DN3006_c0_g1~~TRINITY_DN3006_c0_g1_i1.p1  ORF type:complete len:854 (+),score=188.42 TRINITY_DN3006_c0_g1_i1:81-2642(+)
MHVFLFSDNVSVEEEKDLKELAVKKNLLVMGPDCGTSVLDGVPCAFANYIKRGSIGLVGASGTGLQQVSSLIDRLGEGVSQMIGVGGRDLDERVGGLMMLAGIKRLVADPGTNVIVLVSKPPAPSVASKILEVAKSSSKPFVVNFLGCDPAIITSAGAIAAATLEDTARIAVAVAANSDILPPIPGGEVKVPSSVKFAASQNVIRGLFSGGTFCKEAKLLLQDIHKGNANFEYDVIDLGEDQYCVGKPHPMIDSSTRAEFIISATNDPKTAVVLLDIVIGYGAQSDPAGSLVPSITTALTKAKSEGRSLVFVAFVCGTEADYQGLHQQEQKLLDAGVVLAYTNAQAVRLAASIASSAPFVTSELQKPSSKPSEKTTAESMVFENGVKVLNIGLASFAEPPTKHGAVVVGLEWRPPAGGDEVLGAKLAQLWSDDIDPIGLKVKDANAEALDRILKSTPFLVDIGVAGEAIPGLAVSKKHLLHSGPPVSWEKMCGPQKGAVIGASIFEGWAKDDTEAEKLFSSGEITFSPCHHHGAVGPMAGVISPSMPVVIVENTKFGNRAYSNLNEGLGKVLRFGAYDESVMVRLRWMRDVLGPALKTVIKSKGPIDLKLIINQALQMGDECHNRNSAATLLFVASISQTIVEHLEPKVAGQVFEYLSKNAHFFLNLSMAACKATLDAAHGIEGSSVVTAMARNGTEFGIRLSGTGEKWFIQPSPIVDGLYFPGYGMEDANPDMGDSSITETASIGGFAMAAAPAIVKFVGGSAQDAFDNTTEMYGITLAKHSDLRIPSLDFSGTPTAIDARLVVDSGVQPIINTGVAHRLPGVGQIGAGIARAPLPSFYDALSQLHSNLTSA